MLIYKQTKFLEEGMTNSTNNELAIGREDHDILIEVRTVVKKMEQTLDKSTEANEARHVAHEKELRQLYITNTQQDGDIASMKGMINTLDERIDELEKKNILMAGASWIGIIIASVIAWFRT